MLTFTSPDSYSTIATFPERRPLTPQMRVLQERLQGMSYRQLLLEVDRIDVGGVELSFVPYRTFFSKVNRVDKQLRFEDVVALRSNSGIPYFVVVAKRLDVAETDEGHRVSCIMPIPAFASELIENAVIWNKAPCTLRTLYADGSFEHAALEFDDKTIKVDSGHFALDDKDVIPMLRSVPSPMTYSDEVQSELGERAYRRAMAKTDAYLAKTYPLDGSRSIKEMLPSLFAKAAA